MSRYKEGREKKEQKRNRFIEVTEKGGRKNKTDGRTKLQTLSLDLRERDTHRNTQ